MFMLILIIMALSAPLIVTAPAWKECNYLNYSMMIPLWVISISGIYVVVTVIIENL